MLTYIYRTTTHPVTPLFSLCYLPFSAGVDLTAVKRRPSCVAAYEAIRAESLFCRSICDVTTHVQDVVWATCSVRIVQRLSQYFKGLWTFLHRHSIFFLLHTTSLAYHRITTKFCFTLYLKSQSVEAPLHTLSPEFWPGHFGQNIQVLHIQGPRSYLCISLLSWAQAWAGLRNEKGESGAIKRESGSKAERMQLKDWVTDRSAKRQCD